ncbi:maestro heat-like repeat-containing protein family member 2B [Phasianus colchicus]|uniref:maestro heat-like repeat-containing protein family member 2B n=1 Tax=Phasianus colchicus TaxID=9054 RepID=UPI00129D35B1|nr:maestro heat-like repeat-containing protein family member 2B [Phasianus colchicus]
MESPVTKTMLGNGAQQLLPGQGTSSSAEVTPCFSVECVHPGAKFLTKTCVFWGLQGCPACSLVPSPGHVILCEVALLTVMSQLSLSPLWQRWERWLSPLVGRAGSEPRESFVSIWRHPAVMKRLRALRGLFACVGCMPRCTRRRERGRVESPVPVCAVTLLLQRLQDQEGDRAQAYCELEHVLWEGDSRPPCGVVNRLLAEVSQDLTAAQQLLPWERRCIAGHWGLLSECLKAFLPSQVELNSTRAQATRSALILAHGSLALRASKEQLLARLEGDIVGNILLLYSCSCQDLQNKLALVQSITDFSSAVHAVGGSAFFNPSLKGKLLEILMDLLKKYYMGTPVSPVPLKVILALEQLSKLKPSRGSKDMSEMLTLCCKNIVTHPSAKRMLKIRKSQQAAQYLQLQQTSLKALGRLMVVLLETEPTLSFFQNIVHVLQRSLTSDNMWERKRALQTCSQLLAACEELQRGDACKHFGSLVGLLAPLTCDLMPTSRQLAIACLSSILRIQAKVTNGVIEMGDIGSLCEGLTECSTTSQLRTSSKIARIVCRNLPLEQTVDFLTAIKDTFRKGKGMRVRAAGNWMITFLQMHRKNICRDVLMILYILRSCASSMKQSTFMPFLCQAVVILTRCDTEVMIDNFSRLPKATDSETWRRIREFCLQRWGR